MADGARRVNGGVVPLILRSWRSPRRVYRDLRDMPDRVLIVVLMAAMLIFLIAQAPLNARLAHLDPSVPMGARMGGSVLAVIFILPVLAYGLAWIVAAITRIGPRPLDGRHSRLALFWALLAVSPAMLLTGLTAGMLEPGPAHVLTQSLAGVGFLVIWGAGIIELAGQS